ncbi:MAG: iron ABC transporter substrate-binding protein [Trueperaceae bacterium]|nr:iron ABC transporter substrate-binding protein [Trueperaceae bacterium]
MVRTTLLLSLTLALLGHGLAQSLTLYSGRGEGLVQPLIERFTAETGIIVNVRYGDTAQLAVLLLEEGPASPADVFWGQDAGALGALSLGGRFRELPASLAADLPGIYTSAGGLWVATSGRARVLAYSPGRTAGQPWPESVFDLTDPSYRGRVAWAPTNGSFQSFVTAMRVLHGEDATRDWLRGMMANDVQSYGNNTTQVEAVAAGEVDYALVNNYYLLRFLADDPAFPVAQDFFADGDIGNLVNVAGAGILASSDDVEMAERFLEFLLSDESQSYFTNVVYEYPVTRAVAPNERLVDYDELLETSPEVDLDVLEDLEGTLDLLREVGLL